MKTLTVLWNNKQAITGAVTMITSTLAIAGVIGEHAATVTTAITGCVMTLLALAYTIVNGSPS